MISVLSNILSCSCKTWCTVAWSHSLKRAWKNPLLVFWLDSSVWLNLGNNSSSSTCIVQISHHIILERSTVWINVSDIALLNNKICYWCFCFTQITSLATCTYTSHWDSVMFEHPFHYFIYNLTHIFHFVTYNIEKLLKTPFSHASNTSAFTHGLH